MKESLRTKTWQDLGFEIEITHDQSPTLRLLQSVDPLKSHGESMHHSVGASYETTLIYGNVAADVLNKVINPHFMIVGLGLGYIEMNIAREALKLNRSVGLLTSYEAIPELREFFYSWLYDRYEDLHPEVSAVYDDCLKHVLKNSTSTTQELKSFLRKHFVSLSDIHGPLGEDVQFVSRYHGFFYDAYSSKTHPHLWSEEFLNKVLEQAQDESVLSTYACKGTLKRALKSQGFSVFERTSTFSKRSSLLGTKSSQKL